MTRLEMTDAFSILRTYARDHNLRLTEVAQAVVARSLPGSQVLEHTRLRRSTKG